MRSVRKKTKLEEEVDLDDDFGARPTQQLRIIGHAISCKDCLKELAAFYCPRGSFFAHLIWPRTSV